MTRHLYPILLFAILASTSFGESPGSHLAAMRMQDASRMMPESNVVYFQRETKRISLNIDTSRLRSSAGQVKQITVIDQQGQSRDFPVDENQRVVVSNVSEGALAIVAINEVGHSATVLAVRQSRASVPDEFELDFKPLIEPRKAQISFADIASTTLLKLVQEELTASTGARSTSIDNRLLIKTPSNPTTTHAAQLGRGGALRGQLISIVRPSSVFSDVSETKIMVYRNSKLVGATKANTLGRFQVNDLHEGAHTIIAFGPGGYAACSVDLQDFEGANESVENRYAFTSFQYDGDILPVPLIPPTMIPAVGDVISQFVADREAEQDEQDEMALDTVPPSQADDVYESRKPKIAEKASPKSEPNTNDVGELEPKDAPAEPRSVLSDDSPGARDPDPKSSVEFVPQETAESWQPTPAVLPHEIPMNTLREPSQLAPWGAATNPPTNPLRIRISGSSGGSGSIGGSGSLGGFGSGGLGALGSAGAIGVAIPAMTQDDDAPGVAVSNAGR